MKKALPALQRPNPVPDEVLIPLKNRRGAVLAELRVVSSGGRAQAATIRQLTELEAHKWNEEPIQFLEGHSYDYEIKLPLNTWLVGRAFKPGGLSGEETERGRLDTGQFTGLMRIQLQDGDGATLAEAAVEVCSVKLDYRTQYRTMLEDISKHTIDLVLDLKAPNAVRLSVAKVSEPSTDIQKFFLIKHLLGRDPFKEAMSRIVNQPHESTVGATDDRPIGKGVRPGGNLARQLATRQPRVTLPKSHPLFARMKSVPAVVTVGTRVATRDVPENRFIKYILTYFDQFLSDTQKRLSRFQSSTYKQAVREIITLRSTIASYLSNDFFRGLGVRLHNVPISSPVLLRKAGYREILQFWLRLQIVSNLSWDGAKDIFDAGKKDVAALYEYWVFFELWSVVSTVFKMHNDSVERFFSVGSDGITLNLKSGRTLDALGIWEDSAGALNVRFSYNKSFQRKSNPHGDDRRSYPNAGSWTKPMRPDYTISLWPVGISEQEAELTSTIRHLHFDAKYRVEQMDQMFGNDDAIEVDDSGGGVSKRSDLLKMHSYRDAIRRSISAHVIYPGAETHSWRQYEEIIPGLGAFALKPGRDVEENELADYLSSAAKLVFAQCQQDEVSSVV